MKPIINSAMVIATLCLPGLLPAQTHGGHMAEPPSEVVLYDDLGDHHYAIGTDNPEVQAYFDQGLRLYYAFNHAESVRAFRHAQSLEPGCAMCWWGEALALGPNINLPMDTPAALEAYAAVQQAMALRGSATARERALIEALDRRYVADPPEDRAELDAAYSRAMGELARQYPEDSEIAVLYAESIMDLMPWDYWTEEGTPREGMDEALELLTAVQNEDPRHPGGCHFYIHAVEKLYPERAVPCAERLASLMPGAGHIVHMPGHIYIRVGRYEDAIRANEHAVHADETFIQDQRPGTTVYTAGYYPHNYDFLAFAAMMIGDEARATEAATQVKALIPPEAYGQPGMAFLEHWSIRPLLIGVRFEQWDEILATPEPPAGHPHARGMWHYATGRATAARHELDAARGHLAALEAIISSTDPQRRMEFNQSADLLAIARDVLAGWIEVEAGNVDAGLARLTAAVAHEDALLYGEPPEWSVPTRQDLGAALLRVDRPDEAAAVFRADLDKFPNNHWSTTGLSWATGETGP